MSKKAQERIYFKNRALVEQYRVANPHTVLTRFVKDEADIYRTEWIGYDVAESQVESKEPKAEQPEANQANVPEVA